MSCSERLRIQVSALKSLLDSDNVKVRLAMKELDRLKQLLKDKDMEKAVLQRVGLTPTLEDLCLFPKLAYLIRPFSCYFLLATSGSFTRIA